MSLPRRCFVTTGSIASFRQLLEEVLSPPFLQALLEKGYTDLGVQCGPDHEWFAEKVRALEPTPNIKIKVDKWVADVEHEMLACRGQEGKQRSGVVIGHAGMYLTPQLLPTL
jgi:beta-1,4-N-acetylglucosaminyltransferase